MDYYEKIICKVFGRLDNLPCPTDLFLSLSKSSDEILCCDHLSEGYLCLTVFSSGDVCFSLICKIRCEIMFQFATGVLLDRSKKINISFSSILSRLLP